MRTASGTRITAKLAAAAALVVLTVGGSATAANAQAVTVGTAGKIVQPACLGGGFSLDQTSAFCRYR
jgi:hypothetical protein